MINPVEILLKVRTRKDDEIKLILKKGNTTKSFNEDLISDIDGKAEVLFIKSQPISVETKDRKKLSSIEETTRALGNKLGDRRYHGNIVQTLWGKKIGNDCTVA